MKRKYKVKNVVAKRKAQKANSLISLSRRVYLSMEIKNCVEQMQGNSSQFKQSTDLSEVVNYIVADWFFQNSEPVGKADND